MSEASTADREIVITRVLKAPRDLVFEAWTKPEHVAQWFGPNGFTITTSAMEVRVGGTWRFVMHGPDGTDYRNRVDFLEVVRPERLVYDHGDDTEASVHHFRVYVTFEDSGAGRTLLTMRSVFPSREQRGFVRQGVNDGRLLGRHGFEGVL